MILLMVQKSGDHQLNLWERPSGNQVVRSLKGSEGVVNDHPKKSIKNSRQNGQVPCQTKGSFFSVFFVFKTPRSTQRGCLGIRDLLSYAKTFAGFSWSTFLETKSRPFGSFSLWIAYPLIKETCEFCKKNGTWHLFWHGGDFGKTNDLSCPSALFQKKKGSVVCWQVGIPFYVGVGFEVHGAKK